MSGARLRLWPHSMLGRLLAALWLSAALGLLLFAWLQRHDAEMPIAFTWGLVGLSFPIGLPVGAVVGLLMSQAYAKLGLPYSPFGDLLPSWLVMLAFGYWQWLVLLPRAFRWLRERR